MQLDWKFRFNWCSAWSFLLQLNIAKNNCYLARVEIWMASWSIELFKWVHALHYVFLFEIILHNHNVAFHCILYPYFVIGTCFHYKKNVARAKIAILVIMVISPTFLISAWAVPCMHFVTWRTICIKVIIDNCVIPFPKKFFCVILTVFLFM